jgi:hypothetical protein
MFSACSITAIEPIFHRLLVAPTEIVFFPTALANLHPGFEKQIASACIIHAMNEHAQHSTLAALIIEPLGTFFCGEKTRELLRPLCFIPQQIWTQAVQYSSPHSTRSQGWRPPQEKAGCCKGERTSALGGEQFCACERYTGLL